MDSYKCNTVNVIDMIRNAALFVMMFLLGAIAVNVKRTAVAIEKANENIGHKIWLIYRDMEECKCQSMKAKKKRK